MYKSLKKSDLPALMRKWMDRATVYAPVERGNFTEFQVIDDPAKARFELKVNTRYPPKTLFLPQSEALFGVQGDELKSTGLDVGPRVVVGIRPCDARAIQLLDLVFHGDDSVDPYWAGKREQTILVSVGCSQPLDTCFCTAVGSGPFDQRGSDVLLTDIGDALVADVISERAQVLFEGVPEATRRQVEAVEKLQSSTAGRMEEPFTTAGLKDKLYDLFDSGFWESIGQSCLGCGVCTFLCPTCYCFDIVDETVRGERVRNWDSCMFRIYSQEASGHNPRPTNVERTRQRIMHKYAYFPELHGQTGCTGCGRCVQYCPVDLDIRQIIRTAQVWNER